MGTYPSMHHFVLSVPVLGCECLTTQVALKSRVVGVNAQMILKGIFLHEHFAAQVAHTMAFSLSASIDGLSDLFPQRTICRTGDIDVVEDPDGT